MHWISPYSLHVLMGCICVLVQAQPSMEMDATKGQWEWFDNKGNASAMQRNIVPWLIVIHGIELIIEVAKLD